MYQPNGIRWIGPKNKLKWLVWNANAAKTRSKSSTKLKSKPKRPAKLPRPEKKSAQNKRSLVLLFQPFSRNVCGRSFIFNRTGVELNEVLGPQLGLDFVEGLDGLQ